MVKVNWSGSAFTNANMWLNPNYGDDIATPNGDVSLTVPTTFAQVTHVFFRHAALVAGDVVQADEIKIGNAWSDVVPPGATNPPPSVPLTNPVNGAAFMSPANILLQAAASDSNGTVTNVAFFAGATKLADDATEPYLFNWTGITAGSYALKAVATDNAGASSTSSVVNITVTNASSLLAEDSFNYLSLGGGTRTPEWRQWLGQRLGHQRSGQPGHQRQRHGQ